MYYYQDNKGQQQGPVAAHELPSKGITAKTYVWKQGMSEWQVAGSVAELNGFFRTKSGSLGKKTMVGVVATGIVVAVVALFFSVGVQSKGEITMTTENERMGIYLFGSGEVIIDWGDDSELEALTLDNVWTPESETNIDWTIVTHSYPNISMRTISVTGDNIMGLRISGRQLTSLDMSKNKALTYLDCGSNRLTSLDVSKNTVLKKLFVEGNRLTSLDVSKNTALTELNCQGDRLNNYNQLTSLDVSNNLALERLIVGGNELTILDVSKNTALTELDCSDNQLTSLDVSGATALINLKCNQNQLTSLNVSEATALTQLMCNRNQLTSLDVSKNTALTVLICSDNKLASLDVSNNTALTILTVSKNQLSNLDVSRNSALERLDCSNNKLTSLNVSGATALTSLDFSDNQLRSLDVSKNMELERLLVRGNQLTSLDVSKNKALDDTSWWNLRMAGLLADYSWLIGTWELTLAGGSRLRTIILDERNFVDEPYGLPSMSGVYAIDGDKMQRLYVGSGGTNEGYLNLNHSNRTLVSADGRHFRKISSSTSTSARQSSSGSLGSGSSSSGNSAIDQTFQFINGQTFEGRYQDTNTNNNVFGLVTVTYRFRTQNSSATSGVVDISAQISSVVSGNRSGSNTVTYYIRADGSIVAGNDIFVRQGNSLVSNMKDDFGQNVTLYKK